MSVSALSVNRKVSEAPSTSSVPVNVPTVTPCAPLFSSSNVGAVTTGLSFSPTKPNSTVMGSELKPSSSVTVIVNASDTV